MEHSSAPSDKMELFKNQVSINIYNNVNDHLTITIHSRLNKY
jgi:hypothetical protein